MNASMMNHHVAAARMEQRLAAAEASRLAKEARRTHATTGADAHHPIDWVRELVAAVASAFTSHRHAGATGH